jgi:hypothetical protein
MPRTFAVLRQRKAGQAAEQLEAGDSWRGTKDGYVFTTGNRAPAQRPPSPLASAGVCGGCYSLSYSPGRGSEDSKFWSGLQTAEKGSSHGTALFILCQDIDESTLGPSS